MKFEFRQHSRKQQLRKKLVAVVVLAAITLLLGMSFSSPTSAAPGSSSAVVPSGALSNSVPETTQSLAAGAITLGSPISLSQPVALGIPTPPIPGLVIAKNIAPKGIAKCIDPKSLTGTGAGLANCGKEQLEEFKKAATEKIKNSILSPLIDAATKQITESVSSGALSLTKFVLVDMLSDGKYGQATALECNEATGPAAKVCSEQNNQTWLLALVGQMWKIMLVLLPILLMLAVIQGIYKGNLFLVIRAFVLMLPLAIIGSISSLVLMQAFVNIGQDFTSFIASSTTSGVFADQLEASLKAMVADEGGGGFIFTLLWMLFYVIALFAIAFELLIAKVGIIILAGVSPLLWGMLVTPSTAGNLPRAVRIFLSLAAVQPLVAVALSTAVAMLNVQASGATTATPGWKQLIVMVAAMATCAFGIAKFLSYSPAESGHSEGRAFTPGSVAAAGDNLNVHLATVAPRVQSRAARNGA